MGKLIFVNADLELSNEQRRNIVESVRRAVDDENVNVLVGDRLLEISAASPYQITTKVGEYSKTYGFPTQEEMIAFDKSQVNQQ